MGNVMPKLNRLGHPFGIVVVLVIAQGCWLYFNAGTSFWTIVADFVTGNGNDNDTWTSAATALFVVTMTMVVGVVCGYTPADLLTAAGIPVPTYLPWPLSLLGSRSPLSSGSRGGPYAIAGSPTEPGACGLTNLGNTCYMSATVQCLSAVPELTDKFLSDSCPAHTPTAPAPAAATARAFSSLLRDMWGSAYTAVSPKDLLHTFTAHPAGFVPGEQQDCSEFLVALLDSLHDALKGDAVVLPGSPHTALASPVAAAVRSGEALLLASPKQTGFSAADAAWDNHMSGGRSSLIARLCTGQSVCRTVCPSPGCGGIARSYEALQYVALPLPVVYKAYRVRVVSPVAQLGWGARALGLPESEGGAGLLRPSCAAHDWPRNLPACWVLPVTTAYPCSADVLKEAVKEAIVLFLTSRMPHAAHAHAHEHEAGVASGGGGKCKKKKGGQGSAASSVTSPVTDSSPPSSAAAKALLDSLDVLLAEVHCGIVTRELQDRASTRTVKEDALVAYLAPRWYKQKAPQAAAQQEVQQQQQQQGREEEVLYGATAVLHRHRVWHPDPSPEYMRHPKGKADPLPFLQGIVMPAQRQEAAEDPTAASAFRVPPAWQALIQGGFSKGAWKHAVTSRDDLYSLPQARPDFYPTIMVQPGSLPLLLRVPNGCTMTHVTTAAQGWAELCKMNVLGAQAPYDWEGKWRDENSTVDAPSISSPGLDDSVCIHDTILPDNTGVSAARVSIARAHKQLANAGPWWMGYSPSMHWTDYRGEYCFSCGKNSCLCDAGRLPGLKSRQATLAAALDARPDLLPKVQGEVTAELVEEQLVGSDTTEGDEREAAVYSSIHGEVCAYSPVVLAEQAALLTPLSLHPPTGRGLGDTPEQYAAVIMNRPEVPCTAIPVHVSIPSALSLDWFSPSDLPRADDSLSLAGPWAAYDALWLERERQLPVVRQVLEKRLAAQEKQEAEGSSEEGTSSSQAGVLVGGPSLSLPDPMTAIPIQVVSSHVGGLLFHPPTSTDSMDRGGTGEEGKRSGLPSTSARSGGHVQAGQGPSSSSPSVTPPRGPRGQSAQGAPGTPDFQGAPPTPLVEAAPAPSAAGRKGKGGSAQQGKGSGKGGGKGGQQATEDEEFELSLGPAAVPASSSSSSSSSSVAYRERAGGGVATLAKCLDLYTAEGTLDEGNAWACPTCSQRVRAKQSTALVRAPPVLIVTLKRFVHLNDWGDTEKLDAVVDFPVTALDLAPWMSKESGGGTPPAASSSSSATTVLKAAGTGSSKGGGAPPPRPFLYHLFAVVHHTGTLAGGHYIAHTRHPASGLWYTYNDQFVRPTIPLLQQQVLLAAEKGLKAEGMGVGQGAGAGGTGAARGHSLEEVETARQALKAALVTSAAYVLFYRRRS